MLTFAYIKPDGMCPELWAPIFLAMLRMGISVVEERTATISEDEALALYREHLGKPFYPGLYPPHSQRALLPNGAEGRR